MNVATFLVPKSQVAWIPASATVDQALASMAKSGHPTLPVVRRDGRYLGTVSEGVVLRELLGAAALERTGPHETQLFDLGLGTTRPAIGIGESLQSLARRIVEHDFLAVVDDRSMFIGIVRCRDVLAYVAGLLAPRNDEVGPGRPEPGAGAAATTCRLG